ncbi:hypothetical protein O6H91_17G082100 [Diphasiastrum complanatum]|uniref:Uncharacterized protein n=1 Tax=Diphasiastrum complanatum TaxID=34168 RepID=A0ACC2B8N5_DIPCM|nr:hypothetical protein O6H91_17G082100 [Diphasiastrum complanatum]
MEAMNENHNFQPAIILPKDLSLEPLIDLKWHFESLMTSSSTALQQKQLVFLTTNKAHRFEHPQATSDSIEDQQLPTSETTPEDSENSLRSFQDISNASNNSEMQELYGVFRTFDENGDGKLSIDEIRESMAKLGLKMTEKELVSMMAAIDENGNGFVDLEEFFSLYNMTYDEGRVDGIEEHDEESLKRAFGVFDKNKDGYITAHELQTVISSLGATQDNQLVHCRKMIRGADIDGDGKINFMEFKLMMSNEGCFMLCPSTIRV